MHASPPAAFAPGLSPTCFPGILRGPRKSSALAPAPAPAPRASKIRRDPAPSLLAKPPRSELETASKSAGSRGAPEAPRAGVEGNLEKENPLWIAFILWLDGLLDKPMGAAEYNMKTPFLQGTWEPVTKEHTALPVEVISGEIPKVCTLPGPRPRLSPLATDMQRPSPGSARRVPADWAELDLSAGVAQQALPRLRRCASLGGQRRVGDGMVCRL
jgi:hypothetical protein